MSAYQIFAQPSQQALDSSASVLSGAKLYFYLTGTSTATDAYSDSGLTTPVANPLSADSAGVWAPIFLDPTVTYRIVLKTSAGVTLQTWDPANENVLSQARIGLLLYPRTTAETTAGVTPVNYAYAPDHVGYDVRRAGVTGSGDETTKLQNAFNACNGKLYWPNLTITTSAQINVPAGTEIVCDIGATLAAGASFSTTGWHLLNAKGSLTVRGLNFTAPAVARNTSWKAITCDNSVQALPANTLLIVQNCIISNLDIGVYCDGGALQAIVYAEVSDGMITINTSGTGGGASVRPTVNASNCIRISIKDNYLDASDTTNAVNNIYCLGNSHVEVKDNTLLRGHAVKVLSNSTNAVNHAVVSGNHMQGNTIALLCQADAQPIRVIDFVDNFVDTPITALGDNGVVVCSILNQVVGADAFEVLHGANNTFKNCPPSAWYLGIAATDTFGHLILEGNSYYNVSSGSSGTYGVVNNAATGTYRAFTGGDETVRGNSNTRTYVNLGTAFASQTLSNIIETGCTNARSGINQGTYTGTLVNGVSGAVTGTIRWIERDGIVTLYIPAILDTSTTVAQKQVTGTVPTLIKPTRAQICIGQTADNTTTKISFIKVETSGTLTLYNGTATAFTAAGTCGVGDTTITYSLI